jgi:cysteine desulfurase
MLKLPIYLDNNATTACDARVVAAMLPYFSERFGNAASRNHVYGWEAEEAVKLSREKVANLVGAEPGEIIFTSGATEADNLALKGVFDVYAGKGNHIITCNIEHRAVLDPCRHLEKLGAEVTYLKVNSDGLINVDDLQAAFKPTTVLVAIMYANNEIGTIMPIKAISALARKRGVLVFTDATQAVGKIPVHVNDDEVDLMAFSAHKMYGPKGVGALFVRRKNPRVKLSAQIDGGGHEKGIRSGTLNVPGIVGFGIACELATSAMKHDAERIESLRNKLENALLKIENTSLNGSKQYRLPNVSNISFQDTEAQGLMMSVSKDIAVSSGSACMSASLEPSYVLQALGLPDDVSRNSLRFSLGRFTTEEEIDHTIKVLTNSIMELRQKNPRSGHKIKSPV